MFSAIEVLKYVKLWELQRKSFTPAPGICS
jgi:hypothetical protein